MNIISVSSIIAAESINQSKLFTALNCATQVSKIWWKVQTYYSWHVKKYDQDYVSLYSPRLYGPAETPGVCEWRNSSKQQFLDVDIITVYRRTYLWPGQLSAAGCQMNLLN